MSEKKFSEKEFAEEVKAEKQRLKLKGKTTNFLRGLEAGGFILFPSRWVSKNKQDVHKLLSEHFPVQWSSEEDGIIEVGFNETVGKFVGAHHFHRSILVNPQFDGIEDCIEWYMSKVKKMRDDL